MKKFIFSANVIAIVIMIPAVIFGYLAKTGEDKTSTETVTDVVPSHESGSIIKLVKSF